jgi:hypothetical protein
MNYEHGAVYMRDLVNVLQSQRASKSASQQQDKEVHNWYKTENISIANPVNVEPIGAFHRVHDTQTWQNGAM